MQVDWIPARVTDEGKYQEPGQGQLLGLAKLRQTDSHAFMAFGRLSQVGAEQAVPPGQVEAIVAVGLADDHGMMHPVHVGGDNGVSQYAIKPERDLNISMVEHGLARTINRSLFKIP